MKILFKAKRARWTTLLAIVLTAVAVTGVVLAVTRPTTSGSPADALVNLDAGPPVLRTDNGPSALFIGDSYTAGPGDMPDYGYPCVAATNLGWQCNIAAQPATGYISGGDGHRLPRVIGSLDESSTSLAERFPRLRMINRADVVILDGGRNDFRFGPIYLRNMFVDTVRRAVEAWPNSRIVVIIPWFITDPVVSVPGIDDGTTYGQWLEASLRERPEFDNVTIIDPGALGWFSGVDTSPYMSPDGIHPNLEGNKLIGNLLTAELTRRGFAGSPA